MVVSNAPHTGMAFCSTAEVHVGVQTQMHTLIDSTTKQPQHHSCIPTWKIEALFAPALYTPKMYSNCTDTQTHRAVMADIASCVTCRSCVTPGSQTCLWHPGLQTAAEERQDSHFSHAGSHKIGLRHMHRTTRSVGFGMTHLLSPTQAHNIKTGIHAASLRARAQVNAVPTLRTYARQSHVLTYRN